MKKKVNKNSAGYKKYRRRKILFITELVVLIPLVLVALVYVQFEKKLGTIETVQLDKEEISINQEVKTNDTIHGYTNIALFGVDNRDMSVDGGNTDTIIIASINNDTKVVRLVSVYRDTLLNIGDDMYRKANAAYANGGYKWALNMLNQNMDLDITDFVTVNMEALVDVVDALGGLDFTLTDDEVVHMNNYCVETSEKTGKEYIRIDPEVGGTYHLNGVQAVSYSRIRYTAGNDFKRTQRQRQLIAKIIEAAKSADLGTLNDVMDTVFPMIKTNLSKSEIISMGMNLLSYELGDTCGFPFQHKTSDVNSDSEAPVTLSVNVTRLHDFLFGVKNYKPSATVEKINNHIIELTGFDENTSYDSENFTLNGANGGEIPTETETETEYTEEYSEEEY